MINTKLGLFPLPLINQLGTCSRLDWLLTLPELKNISHSVLFQSRENDLYHINAEAHGLILALQCLNSSSDEEQRWGLRSFTLDAAAWRGPWFENLSLHQTRAEHLIEWLAESADEVMHQHPMLCFPVQGMDDQTWSVIATFNVQQKTLDTFSLVSVGDWREAPPLTQQTAAAVTDEANHPRRPARSLTCLSGAPTPETGVWEGTLPATHAQALVLALAPHRFVFKRAGDAMGTLGLPATDEAMVTWTWLQSR